MITNMCLLLTMCQCAVFSVCIILFNLFQNSVWEILLSPFDRYRANQCLESLNYLLSHIVRNWQRSRFNSGHSFLTIFLSTVFKPTSGQLFCSNKKINKFVSVLSLCFFPQCKTLIYFCTLNNSKAVF